LLGDWLPALQAGARQSRLQNLRSLSAVVRLSTSLGAAGVLYRFFKGPLLSQKIYGDADCATARIWACLSGPGQIAGAVGVLRADGWESRDADMWLKGGVHRRLAKCWALRPERPSDLSYTESMYLCLHGAIHAWSRLKWAGDLAAIIDCQPELRESSQETSAALGFELAVAQTILPLQLLFGVEPDVTGARILERQPQAYALAAYSLTRMQRPEGCGKRRRANVDSAPLCRHLRKQIFLFRPVHSSAAFLAIPRQRNSSPPSRVFAGDAFGRGS